MFVVAVLCLRCLVVWCVLFVVLFVYRIRCCECFSWCVIMLLFACVCWFCSSFVFRLVVLRFDCWLFVSLRLFRVY